MYTIWRGPAHGPIAMPLPQFRRRPDASPADRPHRNAPPPPGRAAGLQRLPAPRRDPSRRGIPSRHAHGVAGRRRRGRGDDPGPVGRPRGLPPRAGRWSWWTADGGFYPPAAVRLGIAPEQLLVVQAEQRADHDWAIGPGVAVPGRRGGPGLAGIAGRHSTTGPSGRWQLAAEAGGSLGLLVRPAESRAASPPGPTCGCWSSRSRPNRIAAACGSCCLRCRGGREGRSVELDSTMNRILCIRLPQNRADQCRRTIPGRPALESLAAWCQRFSPLVGIEPDREPASLLLDITGLAHLFGGEAALAEQVLGDFAARGLRVSWPWPTRSAPPGRWRTTR